MRELLLVGAGGFMGAALRYGVSLAMQRWTGTFPWATLSINVAGCFLIGLLMPVVEQRPLWLALVVPGLLGGFTTVSAWAGQTRDLAAGGHGVVAGAYLALTLAAGLSAAALGQHLSGRREPEEALS